MTVDTDSCCRDVIDTEHSSGDVNKMLLGSFVEEYDFDDDGLDEEENAHLGD